MMKERKGKGPTEGKPRGRSKHASGTSSQRKVPHAHAPSPGIQPEAELARMLETLQPHDHLCLIYESKEEWRAAAVPFIAIGLKRGEKCIYIVDTSTAAEIRKYLAEERIDVASAEKSGQLCVLHQSEAYTRESSFDPDRMIATLAEETEKALAESYPALRVTGEMTWVLRSHPGSEKLLEYEAKLNSDFSPRYPCLTICQYDRWKFAPELIRGVIMTHPLIVRGNRVYRNFYYITPEEFLNEKRAEREVQHWLNSLEREQQIQETLRESEEFSRSIVQTIPDIIIRTNRQGAYLDIISASESQLALPKRELLGRRIRDVLSEDVASRIEESIQEAILTRSVQSVEYQLEVPAGNLWFEARILPLGEEEVISLIRDITDRKQAETEMRRQKELSERLINSSIDGILGFDRDCCYTVWNPGMESIAGVSKEQAIGRCAFEVFPFLKEIGEDRFFYEALKGNMVVAEERSYAVPKQESEDSSRVTMHLFMMNRVK